MVNIEQKKKRLAELQDQLNSLLKRRDQLDAQNDQLKRENYSNNLITHADRELEHNERAIMIIENEIADLKDEVDTWAYTIMGNFGAHMMYWDFLDVILKKLTLEEQEKYDSLNNHIPTKLYTEIINNRCYTELIDYASKKNSRLAFQVLGVLLMNYGARMNNEVRRLILLNSDWKDEEFQLIDAKDRLERQKYLFEFRDKIKNYQEGVITKITVIRQTDLMDKKLKNHHESLIDRPSIDYSLRKK